MADRNATNIGSSALFATERNDHEVGPSTSVVDLTSIGDVNGQAADSGEEE